MRDKCILCKNDLDDHAIKCIAEFKSLNICTDCHKNDRVPPVMEPDFNEGWK